MFTLHEEREIKLVIEGIIFRTPCDTIKEEFATLSYFPTSVSALSIARKQPVNSFLIKLRETSNYESTFHLHLFLYIRVRVISFDLLPGPS